MSSRIKKLVFLVFFNLSLFLILMIGIQNSSSRKNVNLLFGETVNLPISFIIGISFICGSITGSGLTINLNQDTE